MKKILSLAFSLAIAMSSLVAFAAEPSTEDTIYNRHVYSDVTNFDLPELYLLEHQLISGNPDLTVDSSRGLNRAEAVTMFARFFEIEPVYDPNCIFPDVSMNEWYAAYVSALCHEGLVTGAGDGLFHPDDLLNKAEALAILTRGIGVNGSIDHSSLTPDVSTEDWYADYAAFGLAKNIVKTSDGDFGGAETYTRGDLFLNLYRFKRIQEMNVAEYDQSIDPKVEDSPGYLAIQELLNLPVEEITTIHMVKLGMMCRDQASELSLPDDIQFNFRDDFFFRNGFSSRSMPGLEIDLQGGFTNGSRRGLANDLELLTGEVAIDESLQLGSVGSDFGPVNNFESDAFEIAVVEPEVYELLDIPDVEIESHPWEEMLGDAVIEIPEMANLAPSDTLFVEFEDADQYQEFEEVMNDISGSFVGDIYSMGKVTGARDRLVADLGLDVDQFDFSDMDEIGVVSEDLDFMKGTDYALILKFSNPASDFTIGQDVNRQKLGAYTIVATSQDLIDRMVEANVGSSLADEKDFHFALSALDQGDGIIYLSEDFIRKLTSSEYRIALKRRNTAVDAMVAMQYIVFAYRDLNGEWPSSFAQIAEEGWIRENAIFEEAKYSIDTDGHVRHADWGGLQDLTPVNQVPVSEILPKEKELYEDFSANYQRYFTEFFDPIGITVKVDEQVKFNTIILPLVEESNYELLKAVIENLEVGGLDGILDPKRLGLIHFASKFSLDNIVAEEFPGGMAEFEMETADELGIELAEGDRLFDFIGDDFVFAFAGWETFTDQYANGDLYENSKLDAWAGIEIIDHEKAQMFVDSLIESAENDVNSYLEEFTEAEHNGVKFYSFDDFIDIYFALVDDYFYVTLSANAMKSLIDGGQTDMTVYSESIEIIGDNHHMMFLADLFGLANLDSDDADEFLANMFGLRAWNMGREFETRRNYLNEALFVESFADGGEFYAYAPGEYAGAQFVVEDGILYFEGNGNKSPANDVSLNSFFDDLDGEILVTNFVNVETLAEELREQMRRIKTFAVGTAFTEDGLEVNISFGNPI